MCLVLAVTTDWSDIHYDTGQSSVGIQDWNGQRLDTSQRNAINDLPKMLVFELHRYDQFGDKKADQPFKFGLELDMSPFLTTVSQSTQGKNAQYFLSGIVVHEGPTCKGGHYYSFIRDRATGKWHKFDDLTPNITG